MKTTIQPVKGTRDFYPEKMAVRTWLYAKARQVSELYGYQEWEGPFLERIDLYAAKSGEELVKEQAFVFTDRGGDFITLRPELTPTLARMVAQRQRDLIYPLRWWSFGPFWRYERPQKGRTREFFQWNIDLIGVDTPEADAELIAVAASFLESVGLTPDQVHILVNNRRLVDAFLGELGIPEDMRRKVFQLIDRQDKLAADEWADYAREIGLTDAQLMEMKRILSNQDGWKLSEELLRVFAVLDAMNLSGYVRYDPKIVRGLDYYTGTVFEARSVGQEGRAVLGGGRYDNLVADVGGEPLSGVGFAMGDVMIGVVLESEGLLPANLLVPAPVLVTVFDETQIADSFSLAAELRRQGMKVICYPEAAKLPKQLKYADRVGCRFVVIVGPDEKANGQITVKDLFERSQITLNLAEAGDHIRRKLASVAAV
ncbi:MAG: histidine--tRNA ligase [Anaerolineae bacterium]|nr:histidine--tRNA ligase [Anaerolineae bacterium]